MYVTVDCSCLFLRPHLDRVFNVSNHPQSSFYGHTCSCRRSVCPHFIHLFLFCMHTCKYSEYAESKKRFRHSTGLFSLLPAQFAVFGLGFIELALYTWLTPSSSSATITPRCQEVPVLSAQALPALRRTSTASDWFLVRRCDVRFFFFVYLEKEECHIHLALICQHRSLPRELGGTMRCSEDGCLSLRRPAHAIHVQRRPRCEPAEVKTHDF